MSKMIFVDTSAWIMLLNRSERSHCEAVALYDSLGNITLLVTNYIISETYTWLRKKSGFEAAYSFLESMKRKVELNQMVLVYTDDSMENEAFKLLDKFRDHKLSHADAVSICAMKRFGVKDVFAYDNHFIAAGMVQIE